MLETVIVFLASSSTVRDWYMARENASVAAPTDAHGCRFLYKRSRNEQNAAAQSRRASNCSSAFEVPRPHRASRRDALRFFFSSATLRCHLLVSRLMIRPRVR
ncbi:MAG: hypothetical protein ABI277_04695 [Burkholderiaceae bacterium]